MQITFFGATDVGRKRANNEDTFIAQNIWDDEHVLLVAIDGMGGEDGGEIAAETARRAIVEYLSNVVDDSPLNLIKAAMAEANNAIVRDKEQQPRYQRMGCVATAGIFDLKGQTLSIAHVGDSRLYRFSHDTLTKLTHDHSLVGYQEEQGILTEEQAMNHPRRSVIERCLGAELHQPDDKHFIEAGIFPLTPGETYLFCSDGLCDVLTSAEISTCLGQGQSAKTECKRLIDAANEAGGKDNITVVIAHIGKPSDAKRNQSKPIPARAKSSKSTPITDSPFGYTEANSGYTQHGAANSTKDELDEVCITTGRRRRPERKSRILMLIITNIISLIIGATASYLLFAKADKDVAPPPTVIKKPVSANEKTDTVDTTATQPETSIPRTVHVVYDDKLTDTQ